MHPPLLAGLIITNSQSKFNNPTEEKHSMNNKSTNKKMNFFLNPHYGKRSPFKKVSPFKVSVRDRSDCKAWDA
jgi:hypothetical protein